MASTGPNRCASPRLVCKAIAFHTVCTRDSSTSRARRKADALVEYRLEPVTFKLNLINLFDRTYADGIYRGFTVPGAGRSAQVTVATRF